MFKQDKKDPKEPKQRSRSYQTYLAFLLILFLVVSLARNFLKIVDDKKKEEEIKTKVEKLRQENKDLRDKLTQSKSSEYIEAQLRNKLGLAKKGEIVIVLPDEETLRQLAPKSVEEEEVLPDPTWKKWLKLFF